MQKRKQMWIRVMGDYHLRKRNQNQDWNNMIQILFWVLTLKKSSQNQTKAISIPSFTLEKLLNRQGSKKLEVGRFTYLRFFSE